MSEDKKTSEDDKGKTSEREKGRLPRRDFLINSAKVVTAASVPLVLAPASCDNHPKPECPDPPKPSRAGEAEERAEDFVHDVIIIGTGFGATVAATKLLSRNNNLKVLMLERGPWWLTPDANRDMEDYVEKKGSPHQYFTRPDHNQGLLYLASIVKTNLLNLSNRARPLYMHHSYDKMDILTGSGVGGGSLVYLNVTIPAILEGGEYPVFRNWPLKLRPRGGAEPGDYDKARQWMYDWRGQKPLHQIFTEYPLPTNLNTNLDPDENKLKEYAEANGYRLLGKARALRDASRALPDKPEPLGWSRIGEWRPAPLSINELDTNADQGCTRQGRCFLGCLPGAIRTLDKTLLRDLLTKTLADGTPQYPNLTVSGGMSVSHIEHAPSKGGAGPYLVHYVDTCSGQKLVVSASKVIVAAGTLGSTEILLRSDGIGSLKLSPKLGTGFSGNGDLGGFIVDIKNSGDGKRLDYPIYPTRGPMITSYVQYKGDGGDYGPLQMTVEDGGLPPTVAAFTRLMLNFLPRAAPDGSVIMTKDAEHKAKELKGKFHDLWKSGKLPDLSPVLPGRPDPTKRESYRTEHELLEDVFYFQCMGSGEADGVFSLDRDGRLRLDYPGKDPRDHPVYKRLGAIMASMAGEMGGSFVPFPLWEGLAHKLFTLHPLGGCRMGHSAADGVVNTAGQVFDYSNPSKADAVYDGLYVMDASIFPGAVAVNPTLTIVALALRIAGGIRV